MSSKVLDFFKRASLKLVDPGREERIEELARGLEVLLRERRQGFSFDSATKDLEVHPKDVPLVGDLVYTRALERAWSDSTLNEKERMALEWLRQALQLSSGKAKTLELAVALPIAERSLCQALKDGFVDASEGAKLTSIAESLGYDRRILFREYFREYGEDFLRGMFAEMTESGSLTQESWRRLVSSAEVLGLDGYELEIVLARQAERFIEHVLADAKEDEFLEEEEEKRIAWMISHLPITTSTRYYIDEEISKLRNLTNIRRGVLPSLNYSVAGLRSGEIVHFTSDAILEQLKQLRSGPRLDRFVGTVVITDYRMMFSAETRAFMIPHSKVLDLIPIRGGVEIRCDGRGSGRYIVERLGIYILNSAIAKANQRLVQRNNSLPDRHIPRDIRQRVWQRYGGQCAECRATQYLEFDHIVPVAKGGSNSEGNVQLLCRGCNSKKRDLI